MSTLAELRSSIDDIDMQIIDLLAQRFSLVAQIGTYKKQHKLAPLDVDRRDALLKSHLHAAQKKWLSESFVVAVWELLHQESLKIQK